MAQRSQFLGTLSIVTLGVAVALSWNGLGPETAVAEPLAPPTNGEIRVTTLDHPATSVRWGRATGVVDASLEQVMGVVGDYAAYREFMPHFQTSKVLSRRGGRALVYMEALIAKDTLKVWAQLSIQPKQQGDTRIVSAHMMKGNLDHMEARWEVSPLDAGHCLVSFEILVDPKIPLPASLVSTENKKASKRTIRALRTRLAAANR